MASSLLITPAGGSGAPGCGESAPRLGNVGSLSAGAVGSPGGLAGEAWPPEPPRQEGGCFVLLPKPVQGWSHADAQGHPHQVVLRGAGGCPTPASEQPRGPQCQPRRGTGGGRRCLSWPLSNRPCGLEHTLVSWGLWGSSAERGYNQQMAGRWGLSQSTIQQQCQGPLHVTQPGVLPAFTELLFQSGREGTDPQKGR